jgi:hypothetical protein
MKYDHLFDEKVNEGRQYKDYQKEHRNKTLSDLYAIHEVKREDTNVQSSWEVGQKGKL